MTVEHVTVLAPGEVRAIRLVCKKCKSALTIALDQTITVPKDCPVCRLAWQDARTLGAAEQLERLADALKVWSRTTAPFDLGLELAAPPATD